ncbi:MAG: CRTAC1 family protein [Acidobacteriota bacterium]
MLLVCGLLVACGSPDSESGPESGGEPSGSGSVADSGGEGALQFEPRERVAAELQALCRGIQASDERYFGRRRAQDLAAQLRTPQANPLDEAALHVQYGRELLELGEPLRSLEHLQRAAAFAQQQGVPRELGLDLLGSLALTHLQAAEDANCVEHHSGASCILPITAEGVHRQPEHARAAGDYFLQFLEEIPDSVHSAWLLNLSRMVSGDWPQGVPERFRASEEIFSGRNLANAPPTSGSAPGRWVDRAPALGVNAVDLAGGAILEDLDGDGLLDLLSSTSDPCDHLKAFRNRGDGSFEDVSEAWGLDVQLGGLNLIHGDVDGDRRPDILVLRGAWLLENGRMRNSLLLNRVDEGLGFVDVTRASGLASLAAPTQSAAFADYDGDGDLDLYIAHEALEPNLYPSQLMRNDGQGRFEDVTNAAGVANLRYAKAVTWGDYDNDGDPDLYVSNFGPNRLYRNEGDGTFTDVAPQLGVTEPQLKSFTSWFFDYDNDGDQDLFVADYNGPPFKCAAWFFGVDLEEGQPLLYRNDGGSFTEVSRDVGLRQTLLPMGANFGDLDNDGQQDIYLGTGNPEYESLFPNVMFRNLGDRFEDITYSHGFGHLQKGHGVAFGDIDNDGDQDLFHQLGGFYPGDSFGNALFENPLFRGADQQQGLAGPAWLTLRLHGVKANAFGVGARITVTTRDEAGSRRQLHSVVGTGGTFGGSSLQQELGLGDAVAVEELRIQWPGSGTVQTFEDVPLRQVVDLYEDRKRLAPVSLPRLDLSAAGHGSMNHGSSDHASSDNGSSSSSSSHAAHESSTPAPAASAPSGA